MRRTAVTTSSAETRYSSSRTLIRGGVEAGVERTHHVAPGAEARQGFGERLLLVGLDQRVQLRRASGGTD